MQQGQSTTTHAHELYQCSMVCSAKVMVYAACLPAAAPSAPMPATTVPAVNRAPSALVHLWLVSPRRHAEIQGLRCAHLAGQEGSWWCGGS